MTTKSKYPRLAASSSRYAYWELGPERFNAFPRGWTPEEVAGADNGAGYYTLGAIVRLKGDTI